MNESFHLSHETVKTKKETEQVKADMISGVTKLLYVAPESLTKEDNIEFLKSVKIFP